jgi:murein L,D-transpeptidase YcbB/YkuD
LIPAAQASAPGPRRGALFCAATALALLVGAPAAAQGPIATTTRPPEAFAERLEPAPALTASIWFEADAPDARADALIRRLRDAAGDGLDPAVYQPDALEALVADARSGDPAAREAADAALSETLVRFVRDLRQGRAGLRAEFIDPGVSAPPPSDADILAAAAQDDDLAAALRMNPIYESFRRRLAANRSAGGDPAEAALILANLERARLLPPELGDRYILVDTAARQLWLYRDGQLLTAMKVAVGKPSLPTPIMTGLIRHAIFNPYWNVPADLVRTTVARNVLDQGLAYLQHEGMVVYAGYEEGAAELDPATLDWQAIYRGDLEVRVRQKPGPRNMMGKVKLMLPNPLGIYLHDTPNKAVFGAEDRYVSSGCVRLADALALAGLLFDADVQAMADAGDTERQVDFDRPIPVYITYFTAMPEGARLARREDIYGRDQPLLARLAEGTTIAAVAAP